MRQVPPRNPKPFSQGCKKQCFRLRLPSIYDSQVCKNSVFARGFRTAMFSRDPSRTSRNPSGAVVGRLYAVVGNCGRSWLWVVGSCGAVVGGCGANKQTIKQRNNPSTPWAGPGSKNEQTNEQRNYPSTPGANPGLRTNEQTHKQTIEQRSNPSTPGTQNIPLSCIQVPMNYFGGCFTVVGDVTMF